MEWKRAEFDVQTRGKGLYAISAIIEKHLHALAVTSGMCFLFIRHTSASLIISESYDPSAKTDMERYMEKAVPENQSWYVHNLEGADDSPSHIRAMLTHTSLSIPVEDGGLDMGTWQGVYLFEHRTGNNTRRVAMRILAV